MGPPGGQPKMVEIWPNIDQFRSKIAIFPASSKRGGMVGEGSSAKSGVLTSPKPSAPTVCLCVRT